MFIVKNNNYLSKLSKINGKVQNKLLTFSDIELDLIYKSYNRGNYNEKDTIFPYPGTICKCCFL